MKNICIGIDISKETFDVTLIFVKNMAEFNSCGYSQFDNAPHGFRSLVAWVRKIIKPLRGTMDDCLFCMETTGGYDLRLCNYLYEHKFHVWRESALQIRRSSGFRRGKNDKADSLNIANYAAKNQDQLQEYEPDSEKIKDLKELVRYRDELVNRRRQCMTRIKAKGDTVTDNSSSVYKFIQKQMHKEEKELDDIIDAVEKKISEVIVSDKTMQRHYDHITSIKGVSLVNASAIIAFSGDFKNIRTANKMACYCGAVTFYDDSGTSVHKKDPNKNICCKKLKSYLSMAARCAMRDNPELKSYADRMLAKGKLKKIVANNVINKLLHIIYSLVLHDCDYEPEHEKKRMKEIKAA